MRETLGPVLLLNPLVLVGALVPAVLAHPAIATDAVIVTAKTRHRHCVGRSASDFRKVFRRIGLSSLDYIKMLKVAQANLFNLVVFG